MRVLAVVGGDPPLAETADRLCGRVAVIDADESDRTRTDAGEPDDPVESSDTEPFDRFELDSADRWHGRVQGTGFGRLLDRLAPEYDYALVGGRTRLRVPTVVVGSDERAEPGESVADTPDTSGADAHETRVTDTPDTSGTDTPDTSGADGHETRVTDARDASVADAPDTSGANAPDASVAEELDDSVVARLEPASVDPATLATTVREVEPYVTLETLVESVKHASSEDRAGAIATFTGRVRAKDGPDDTKTTHLAFERYDEVATRRLQQIESELTDREGVFDVQTHHRTGLVAAGEDIVFVVVLAGHRQQAFEAVSDGIDRLKQEVPLFKKEITTEDTFWKHDAP